MGSCTNKGVTVANPSSKSESNSKQRQSKPNSKQSMGEYGLVKHAQSKVISFNHSPLRNCDYLFSKFNQSDGSPQEVSLNFMLNKCEISIQKKQILLYLTNINQVKIWILYNGIQKVSETGLTIQIGNYKQLQLIQVKNPSINTEKGDLLEPIALKQTPKQNILVIIEPLLSNSQTIFMIYRYQILPQQRKYTLITQSMQWSSLAFKIEDIYGSEMLFKHNDENQICSICLTGKSQCILLPCRHACLCSSCQEHVEKTKPICPLCRKEYYSVVKFVSGN